MKTKVQLRKMIILSLTVLGFGIVASCGKDEMPPNPTDETKGFCEQSSDASKGHDRWGKVEFIFRKGHLHGIDFHGNVDGDDPYFPGTQKVVFEVDDKTKNIVRKDEKGTILQTDESPILMLGHLNYSLEIIYYNSCGHRINSQFVSQEMAPIHQHFFLVNEFTDLDTGETKKPANDELMGYRYRDTDPEDVMIGTFKSGTTKESKLTNDPIGLKGYFTHKRGRTKYNLQVYLAHLLRGNKYSNNGKAWGFNNPSNGLLAASVPDFSQSIPIVVVTTPTDGTEESFEKMMEEMADYFNISLEEIKKNMLDEDGKIKTLDENSTFWL